MKNHKAIASHEDDANQEVIASHKENETQKSAASHKKNETQTIVANPILKELGRMVAGSYYDHQEVRKTEMNRIRDIIRRRIEGLQLTGKPEAKKEKKEEKDYEKKYTDKQLFALWKQAIDKGLVSDDEVSYLAKIQEVQKNAEKYEALYKNLMQDYVEKEPIYQVFLSHIRGISSVLSANLLKEFGYCEKAPHISSLWKYTGFAVVNGEAPKRKKGEKLDFSIRLRTMCWKISDSFVKQRTPFYRDIYDREKARQLKLMENAQSQGEVENQNIDASQHSHETHSIVATPPKSLLHADMRARRKMVKIFLAHYWMCAKELTNQPLGISKPSVDSEPDDKRKPIEDSEPSSSRKPMGSSENQPYVSSHLGHTHISDWKEAVMANMKPKDDDEMEIEEDDE